MTALRLEATRNFTNQKGEKMYYLVPYPVELLVKNIFLSDQLLTTRELKKELLLKLSRTP
jgi:hypothetical protein